MGVPDGAHTHGSNGGWLMVAVVIVGAGFAARYGSSIADGISSGVSTVIDVVMWCALGVVAAAALAVVAIVWRTRREDATDAAARARRPAIGSPSLRAEVTGQRVHRERPLPPRDAAPALPPADGPAVHHHWHLAGVSAEELAAALDAYRKHPPGA